MANALHQAHARTDLPACLDALDEAEKEIQVHSESRQQYMTATSKLQERIAEVEKALNGRRERIEQLEDELGPLRAFQRNHPPGGCE